MRNFAVLSVLLAPFYCLGPVPARAATAADPATAVSIRMKSISFEPKEVEIQAGQSIIWENVSLTAHTATSEDGGKAFDTGGVEPKHSSKAIAFPKTGKFTYHCAVHGRTMTGVVIVKEGTH